MYGDDESPEGKKNYRHSQECSSSAPASKKIKQEVRDSDDDKLQQYDSDVFYDINSPCSSLNHMKTEEVSNYEEEWQAELKTLVDEGEATFDDYSDDVDCTLKWIVKHGIRLAITCVKCGLMEHDDSSQLMEDHGISCVEMHSKDAGNHEKDETYRVQIEDIPRPFYADTTQIALRKSLDKHKCKLQDLPDKMRNWPFKFIMGQNGKKRAGMCTFCGEIFLSIDYKKWMHQCWLQDNEDNGFLINENEYNQDGYPVNETVEKNSNLLNFLINKTLIEEKIKDADTKLTSNKNRLLKSTKVYDREWACSIRDRLHRGELKQKLMLSDPSYCIRYLVNSKGVILAAICANCTRIFSPQTNSANRIRHVQVCYLDELKSKMKQQVLNTQMPVEIASYSSNPSKKLSLPNIKCKSRNPVARRSVRARNAYLVKKMDKNISYNINLESLMVKSLATDILPVDTFYTNGMKAFFNKLLKIGYELGQQPGTVLPTFDDILPDRDIIEINLHNLVESDKFQTVFGFAISMLESVGGTLTLESVGIQDQPAINNDLVAVSFVVMDEWTPKRLVVDLLEFETADRAQHELLGVLQRLNVKPEMCNLFVNRCADKLMESDQFVFKYSCFGTFLNRITKRMFDPLSLTKLPVTEQDKILKLRSILDEIPLFFTSLLKKNLISPSTCAFVRFEHDSRWFVDAALTEKLLLLLENPTCSVQDILSKVDNNAPQRQQIVDFISSAIQHVDLLRKYKSFIDIFISHLEPCAASRRATAHLVVLKFHIIRETLKQQIEQRPSTDLKRHLCVIAAELMSSMESDFLTETHFFATLLSPGHRSMLDKYYDKQQVSNYIGKLSCAISLTHPSQKHLNGRAVDDNLDLELKSYFETIVPAYVDPLQWWAEAGDKLAPRIAAFAKRLFTLPAASTQLDKTVPPHLTNTRLSEFLRDSILSNWTASSELQSNNKTSKRV